MFNRVLWNCPKSVTETIKTHTKRREKLSNKFLKEGADSNFRNKSLNRLLNNILFQKVKQLG